MNHCWGFGSTRPGRNEEIGVVCGHCDRKKVRDTRSSRKGEVPNVHMKGDGPYNRSKNVDWVGSLELKSYWTSIFGGNYVRVEFGLVQRNILREYVWTQEKVSWMVLKIIISINPRINNLKKKRGIFMSEVILFKDHGFL